VIFPELLGEANGLESARETLEMLSKLAIDTIIPGHGSLFVTVDAAFERAFRRLSHFENNIEQLAWHAIKVIVSFAMMEKRRLPLADFPAFVLSLPFAVDVNTRYLDYSEDKMTERLERELLLVNALRREDGWLVAG
jgi:glyoxylase-like metal-dependent hydrolase (beta-lactamase superfamily II)